MRLGFGFIGAGEIALAAAKAIQTSTHARLVRVTDARVDLAGDLVNSYGGSPAATVEELLADPLVEAVYLATPHYLHTETTAAILRVGPRSRPCL